MKNIKKLVFIFVMIVLLTGCNSNESSKESRTEKVTDESVLTNITNVVTNLEQLPKTLELYKKGSAEVSDYTDEDKIMYAINDITSSRSITNNVTEEKQKELVAKGINGVSMFIPSNEVAEKINTTFGISSVKHLNITGCDNYLYVEEDKNYYVQHVENCEEPVVEDALISKLGEVKKQDNNYTAEVYVGVISNNSVYYDLSKSKVAKALAEDESYSISDEDKTKFTKVIYTFKNNENNNIVLVSYKVA